MRISHQGIALYGAFCRPSQTNFFYGEKARKNVTKAKAYLHLNMTPMWRCP